MGTRTRKTLPKTLPERPYQRCVSLPAAREASLIKKLRRGKITQQDFDRLMGEYEGKCEGEDECVEEEVEAEVMAATRAGGSGDGATPKLQSASQRKRKRAQAQAGGRGGCGVMQWSGANQKNHRHKQAKKRSVSMP